MIRTAFAVTALSLVSAAAPAQDFTADRFRGHVEYLASDLMEGRDAGTRGYDLAASYVATRFLSLGLTPAGTDRGWYQTVPFVEAKPAGAASIKVGATSFDPARDVAIGASTLAPAQELTAKAVFVGYGLQAPKYGFDDYRGLDVRGKYVVVLSGFPKGTPSEIGAALNATKARAAADRGALGVITVPTNADEKRRPIARTIESAAHPSVSWEEAEGKPYALAPEIRITATFGRPAAQALFAGAPRNLDQVLAAAEGQGAKIKGFALTPTVAISRTNSLRRFTSPNVLGVLPGSDPALANEYVLLMAHLDHVGVEPKKTGDQIFNGAMDNATGIATMLEVARAMAESGTRPKRSILFAAVTAEERGLLGSEYLAKHPVVAANGGKVVGVVNLDMPVLLYDFTDVIAFGANHSSLGGAVQRAGAQIGVALAADPLPEENLFTRSDHYKFVREGVPAVFLMTGFGNGGGKQFTDFLATHYHKVTDETKLPIDWTAGAKFAKINYLIAKEIADAPAAPTWNKDSFFNPANGAGKK
jgi:Zn-dependent M28 family amino/carboxypeptidase